MKKTTILIKNIVFVLIIMTVLSATVCISTSAASSSSQNLNIAYCNLSFESDTHIMYAIKSNDANVTLLVWSEPQNEYTLGTQKTTVAPLSEQMTINGELYTVFKYTGVAAKQMTDNVYVRACIDNGNGDITYGDVHKYSILQYAYNKLGKTGEATTNQKLINMLNNMLTYGASAQEYHNYKTDRLATDEFVQVKLTDGTLPDGFKHGLYLVGESVTISAPEQNADGTAFTQWKDKSGTVIGNTAIYALTVGSTNNTYTPEYVAYSSGLEFESNGDGTCYLIGIGDCTDTDIKIPAKSPDGDTVIGIDRNAFSGESAITSVSIPASVEEIGRNAFNGCTALTDVYYDGSESDWALIDIATGNTVIEDAIKHFAAVESFTVTFVDYDGTVLKTETVNKGAAATAPANPTRDGYTFNTWDVAFDNVTNNLIVTATYTQDNDITGGYTVTFYDYDGTTVLATDNVESGLDAKLPSNPTRSGYVFTGWDGIYQNVTSNQSVVATYVSDTESNLFVIDSADATVGNTFTVEVNLTGTVKLLTFDMCIYYDPNVLEVVSFDDQEITINHIENENLFAINFSQDKNRTKEKYLTEITFKVKDDVSVSDTQIFFADANDLVYVNDSGTYTDAEYTLVSGWVHIS